MKIFFLILLCVQLPAFSKTFEEEIKALDVGSLKVPEGQTMERTYAVQNRANRLANKFSLSLSGAKNVNAGAYVNSQEGGGEFRYFFSDRFFASLYGAYVGNILSDAGDRLWKQESIFPDISSVKKRGDLQLGYNLFYGKFRLSMDTIFYFDHYVTIGAGAAELYNGFDTVTAPSAVAGTGLTFWFSDRWSAGIGIKDHFFNEYRLLGRDWVHHVLLNASIGFLLGGDDNA